MGTETSGGITGTGSLKYRAAELLEKGDLEKDTVTNGFYKEIMKRKITAALFWIGLLIAVHQIGIRVGRLEEKEICTQNTDYSTELKTAETGRNRQPAPYVHTQGMIKPEGFSDWENTIFYQDFCQGYWNGRPKGIDYFIALSPQFFLEDYFDQRNLIWLVEKPYASCTIDICCIFYDNRTIDMSDEELEMLFLENGYELSICRSECKGYQVRFLQYGYKDSGRLLYPEHIVMQTWNDEYIYVQEITSPMQRKIMEAVGAEERENPLLLVHSSCMTRECVPKEELSFWEFDGKGWLLVPLDLEMEYTRCESGKTLPGEIEEFNPVYYKDGIAFGSTEETGSKSVSYLKVWDMRKIERGVFQFSLREESLDSVNFVWRPTGWIEFTIKSEEDCER